MEYIYDILLNFKKEYIDFFDWNTCDDIIHIRKIPIIKVDDKTLFNLVNKSFKFDSTIKQDIENKTEVYTRKGIKKIRYACLFTNGNKVIGIKQDKSINKSSLLLDEEYDVIYNTKLLKKQDLKISYIKDTLYDELNTRNHKELNKNLNLELRKTKNNPDKLKYLYLEFFEKQENDLNKIYFELLNNLNDNRKQELLKFLKYKNV